MRSIAEICQGEILEELEIKCAMSFKLFRLRVLGRPNHSKFHDDIFQMINKYKRTLVKLPRQHTKSTTISDFFIWKMYYNKGLAFLLLSHGLEGAKDNLKIIVEMIEDNQLLVKKLAPEDRKFSWSKVEIRTRTSCKVVAKANNRRVKGGSYHYVFADEVAEYEDKNNFFEVVIPTVNTTQGAIIAAGTPVTKFDLLAMLEQNPIFAIYANPCIIQDKEGKDVPLWDFKYTLELPADPKEITVEVGGIIKTSLPAIKRQYESSGKMSKWWTEMMITPVSDEASVYPDERILACCDETEGFEEYSDKRFQYCTGADFAVSQAAQADYNAWLVARFVTKNKIKLVNAYWKLGVEERTKEEFIKFYFRYNNKKAVIDNSNFVRVWLPDFIREGIKAEGYDFKSTGQSREELLQVVKDALFSGKVIFPRDPKDPKAKIVIDELIEQLRSFREEYDDKKNKVIWKCTGRHDDLVIALGLLIKAAELSKASVWFGFADV